MRPIAAILAMLSISSDALAMGGPVYVDSTCDTMREAKASQHLKDWFKELCPRGEASSNPICADFVPFVKDVSANNVNWRRTCKGQ